MSAPSIPFRLRVAAGAAVALVICISVSLVLWAGWREVAAAALRISAPPLAAVLTSSLGCYAIRFVRWQMFTHVVGHSVPWHANLKIYLSGLGFTWTPAKSGELLRGVFLARYGVPLPTSVLLFYWDRLSDLAGIFVLAAFATLALASGELLLLPAALAVVVILWLVRPGGALFSWLIALVQHRVPAPHQRWFDGLLRLRDADARLSWPGVAGAVAAGAAAYSLQALGMMLIADALAANLSFASALLVTSVSTLAGAAVLLPAGAGVVETTSVSLLIVQGLSPADAVAVGLLHRLATFWFALALGAGALVSLGASRRHA